MATVNPYFQSGVPMGRSSEQNIYEDLIIECMKIYGFELYYLPRKAYNEDRILGEDPLNNYEHAYPIEMYLESNTGFEGQGEFLSRFGVETVEIDTYPDIINEDVRNFVLLQENGDELLIETNSESPIINESYSTLHADDGGARNEDFDTNIADILDFSERNPFGEVFK
jgi:hypothetical protein